MVGAFVVWVLIVLILIVRWALRLTANLFTTGPPHGHHRAATRPSAPAYPPSTVHAPASPRPREACVAERAPRPASWIPPGQDAQVAGYHIRGGMLYVGEQLPSVSGGDVEPALIDPRLQVSPRAGTSEDNIPYWPSYSRISPQHRAHYLQWLADGRSDPTANIGYVFMFFYGLERRLLADARGSEEARRECPQIAAEVGRLLASYGSNGSFHGYASAFLAVLPVLFGDLAGPAPKPPTTRNGWEYPLSLKYGLAMLVTQGQPVPWQWALAWYLCSPEVSLRTASSRCLKELRALFAWRYVAKYGEGMRIPPNKTYLRVSYRPASPSFHGAGPLVDSKLPDVTALSRPFKAIRELSEQCVSDLDAYSRWLGRNPEGRGTLAATALLPEELVRHHRGGQTTQLRESLESILADKPMASAPGDSVLSLFPGDNAAKRTKKETVNFVQLLTKMGYGVEPDIRFGGPCLAGGDQVVIFRLPEASPVAPSDQYALAALLTDLFIVVSAADGNLGKAEYELLVHQLRDQLMLSPKEAVRLNAHLWWLYHTKPSLSGLQKRVACVPGDQRQTLSQFLVHVACADGGVSPPAVAALGKVYRLLGLDENQVHSDIHTLVSDRPAAATEPVSVAGGDGMNQGFVIPSGPPTKKRSSTDISLDMSAIQGKIAETARVAQLLTSIFGDEDQCQPSASAPTPSQAALCVCGLDAAHSALLQDLQQYDTMDRSEFEELAARHALLPDGALDRINDAALERCDECVCEGDEVICVDNSVLKEMLANP